MRLRDLDARFVGSGGEGIAPKRTGIGMWFKCPCGKTHDEYDRVFITFANPLDGGPPIDEKLPKWRRTGETIDDISLEPSIQRTDPNGCKWHGYVTNGETRTV